MIQRPLKLLKLAYLVAERKSEKDIPVQKDWMDKILTECDNEGKYGVVFGKEILDNRTVTRVAYNSQGFMHTMFHHSDELITFEEFLREGRPRVITKEISYRGIE